MNERRRLVERLDAGADIELRDKGFRTACQTAIYYDQFDALKLLVERGAKLKAGRLSLLVFASHNRRSDQILLYLLDIGTSIDDLTPRELIELVHSVAIFKSLVTRGVNFDAMQDECGYTLCHHVARSVTDENDFRALVDVCGTHALNAIDEEGETPLHCVTMYEKKAAMRVLVESGANIDQQDDGGQAVLHIAANRPRQAPLSCLELLLAVGADVHVVTDSGETAFSIALDNQNKSAFSLLLAAGGGIVDLDQPNDDGESLRMIAEHNDVELPTADEIVAARQRIAKTRLDLVRGRAAAICIGLQSLRLNALQLCEIMMHSFGALGSLIAFHQWWAIATKVKHFPDRKQLKLNTKQLKINYN